jgi:hypothetical protein
MALRNGHGTGAGVPRIEVLPPDELPQPVPAPARQLQAALATVQPPLQPTVRPEERVQGGAFATGATTVQAMGGRAKAAARRQRELEEQQQREREEELRRTGEMLGLSKLVAETSFGPYLKLALQSLLAELAELGTLTGGKLGPLPSRMLASSVLQFAASRWMFDRGAEQNDPGLMKQGSALANDSRQNAAAAYEYAVRWAKARSLAPIDDAAEREAEAAFDAKVAREREQREAEEAAEAEALGENNEGHAPGEIVP